MRVRVLGRCEVGGAGLRFRQAELVGLLAVRREAVPRATVASLLWPEVEASVARHNLRQTLVALKGGGVECVRSEGDVLALTGVEVDLWELFDRLEGDFEPFGVDELLPDVRGEWVYPAREALARGIVAAALRRGEASLPVDPTAALAFARMALAQDPWLESSRSLLIRALLAGGERARAEREIATFEAGAGGAGRLRDLLRSVGASPLDGLDYGALSPNARVRLLTAAATGDKGRAALAAALAAAPGLGARDRALAEAALASLAMEEGDLAAAETLARAAHAGGVALPLVRVLARTDRPDEALAVIDGAEVLDDWELRAGFDHARGVLFLRRHAFVEAERAMRRALGHAQAAGAASLVARIRQGLATGALWAGRLEAATREVETALGELGEGLAHERAILEMTLGRLRETDGRWTEARAAYSRAVAALRDLHDPWSLAQGLTHLGDLARRRGAPDEAVEAYREAIALRRGIGDRLGLATALKGLGQALGAEGEAALRESLRTYLASGDPLGGAAAHLPLARFLRDAGRREEALAHALRAAERLGRMKAEAAGLSTDDTTSPTAARALVAELEATR